MTDEIAAFWEAARPVLASGTSVAKDWVGLNFSDIAAPPAWMFGDESNPELANELLDLVLAGTKTGTASLVVEYDDDEPLPVPGDLSIVLDGAGQPRAIIRTTAVAVVPYGEVTAEFAYTEGEGDRTLEYWREAHEWFWREYLPEGLEFSEDLEVVCENFELVYPR